MTLAMLELLFYQALLVRPPVLEHIWVTHHVRGGVAVQRGRHLQQAAGIDQGRLAGEQLGAQPLELALVLAQQRALVHVLVEPRRVLDVLGAVGELERRQRLCGICIAAVKG